MEEDKRLLNDEELESVAGGDVTIGGITIHSHYIYNRVGRGRYYCSEDVKGPGRYNVACVTGFKPRPKDYTYNLYTDVTCDLYTLVVTDVDWRMEKTYKSRTYEHEDGYGGFQEDYPYYLQIQGLKL